MTNKHIGSTLDSWLEEEGIKDDAEDLARCHLLASRLAAVVTSAGISKPELASRIQVTERQIEELLDGRNVDSRAAAEALVLAFLESDLAAHPEKIKPADGLIAEMEELVGQVCLRKSHRKPEPRSRSD